MTDPEEWLTDLFEFERCSECGGDAEDHTAVPLLGHWFARCDRPDLNVEGDPTRNGAFA